MRKWLILVCYLLILAGAPAYVYGQEGIGGGYVIDPVISVPANSYTTFSTVYNGKRYYLGVDTTAAKSGKDTIAVYDAPCYAAMWIAGPMWSPTGEILRNKDYTRTVKSVWIEENCKDTIKEGKVVIEIIPRKRFLSVGADKKNYSLLVLRDTANSTLWHTAKDFTVQSQYMHGFTYFYSDDGTETYRYLAYDPVYGFSRLYGDRPSVSQRISVWDRHQGADIKSVMTPSTYTFGLNLTEDTVKLPITSQVQYFEYVDRFRSRYDQIDIYAAQSDPIIDQSELADQEGDYALYGYYEWASNPRETPENTIESLRNYNGKSLMSLYGVTNISCTTPAEGEDPECTLTYGKADSTMMWVKFMNYTRDDDKELWYDTIYAIVSYMVDTD